MNRTMLTAANTMNQLQKQFDIISNNIANSQTTGFKSRDVSFSDLIHQELYNGPSEEKDINRLSPYGIRQGIGAKMAKSAMNVKQGTLQTTSRSLDFAFSKADHFLKVAVQEGNETALRFTRNGALYVTPAGNNQLQLVTQDGHAVLDENDQPILFSNQYTNYEILPNGTFQARNQLGQDISVNLGVISLQKPQFMEQKGDSLIGLPDNVNINTETVYANITGADRNNIGIQQRALEGSNVDLSKEMTDMLNVQRTL